MPRNCAAERFSCQATVNSTTMECSSRTWPERVLVVGSGRCLPASIAAAVHTSGRSKFLQEEDAAPEAITRRCIRSWKHL